MSMPKYIEKECKHHGLTEFVLEGRNYYRCKTCRWKRVAKQRQKVKQKLVEEFGGCCQICGYNKSVAALQFHHLDPAEKSFGISFGGMSKAYKTLLAEARKCALLCANCHAEVESGVTIFHGG